MTETILSLVSIISGIIGASIVHILFKPYSLGITSNILIGVFGSVFFIKSFGRLGFDPTAIIQEDEFKVLLFLINISIAFISGFISVIFLKIVTSKFINKD